MSLVPGAIFATLMDYVFPHLTSLGFVYSFIAGMIFFIVCVHVLSSLLGNRQLKRQENEPLTFLRTKLY